MARRWREQCEGNEGRVNAQESRRGSERRARAEAGWRARGGGRESAGVSARRRRRIGSVREAVQLYSSLPNGVSLVSSCIGASVDPVPS
jgi:hypothetical protein